MNALEKQCESAGLKMTGPRRVIIRVLGDSPDHPSVETVCERVKAVDPSISMATVYRTLNLLDEMNLVTRHDFKENFSRYEINTDHHHHLIDVETGQVIEFENDEIEAMKQKICCDLGYDLVECRLELYARRQKTA